ncbi:MAG: nucleotide exchange factor GrpE [Rhodospirillales bacterium]|nr:nucleotide exchange factor GrpE [Rhodospirillales bacterium]
MEQRKQNIPIDAGDGPDLQAGPDAAREPGEAPAPDGEVRPAAAEPPASPPDQGLPQVSQREHELEAEIATLRDKLLRALAETENVRRRGEREREDTAKYAIASFARELVSVADNFNRALASIDETLRKDAAAQKFIEGIEITQRELQNIFKRFGITPIEAIGQKFDHNLHEALFEYDAPDQPHGTVGQVLETGYTLGGRLLRPAKVGVTKGGPKGSAEPQKEAGGDGANKASQSAYEKKPDATGSQVDEEL